MYKINKPYDIEKLVDRFSTNYKSLTGNTNGITSKIVIKTPDIQLLNKKVYIKNFTQVCDSIKRDPSDVSKYFADELQVQTSIAGDGSLIIHGMYRKHQLEGQIKKYVLNYVQCFHCKSQDTKIEKIDRIIYMFCNKCHAKTSISENK